ncbi:TetR/AcrR family transcriptional regulator [Streptomyces sp. NPDC005805]|uniref:TetR/AcrR family transcriptional regulator n=1 Tax=Streptomyces sp. NPDC005805 TaxID=3157068 RepID=UPI0033E2A21B
MRQARAEGTRSALLLAAAHQFDRHGYEGTSLVAISDLAAVSKGALSFHFSSKPDLADSVQELACSRARAELDDLAGREVPGLQTVVDMSCAVAHRLATDFLTRAGLRLARERGTAPESSLNCRSVWRDALHASALRAREDGSLNPEVAEDALVELALALVVHQEAVGPEEPSGTRDRGPWLAEVWQALLPALAPAEHPWTFRTDGHCTTTVS